MEVSGAGGGPRAAALPAQAYRKQWRPVTEQSSRNSSNEELERSRMGQSDERLIYEVQQGREQGQHEFSAISIDGEVLQQRLHTVVNQREELQEIEVELKAQLIARNMIMEMKNRYDAQIKDHATTSARLQDQLREKEHRILELERMLEEKERELHAAWAKEDLLREQSKELQTFRRELDNSEAERVKQMKQVHDLQERFQEKERQLMELQEQNTIAQENINFKDERLREAQNWISQAQEMDALQSCTNHSLQAELRERTEQYNQLWIGCTQQYGEMERLHHHIQQLQHELAEAREKNGKSHDGQRVDPTNSRDLPHLGQMNGTKADVSENGVASSNSGLLPSSSAEYASSFVSVEASSNQTDHVHGIQVTPTSLFGFPSYFPPEQVSPFVIHQPGGAPLGPSHVTQSHASHFQSAPTISNLHQWQKQQAASERLPTSTDGQYCLQADSGLLRSESNNIHESSVNGHIIQSNYADVNSSPSIDSNSVVASPKEKRQVYNTDDSNFFTDDQSQKSLNQISSQFHDALRLNSHGDNNQNKVEGRMSEQPSAGANLSLPKMSPHDMNFSNLTMNANPAAVPEVFSSTGHIHHFTDGKVTDAPLLDERSLLASIVRTIPPGSGGRIRISSTLPNRLGKMLAPLHWHDYKRKYGKLDDFVASHPELFVLDGDYIQLREGAHETIAKNTAVAKVAAAAAVTSSLSSLFPSVAVTPLAHSSRLKVLSNESASSGKSDVSPRRLELQNQYSNGESFHVSGGVQNVEILNKPKDHMEFYGSEYKSKPNVILPVANGTKTGRNELGSSQNKIPFYAATNVIGKQQLRVIGAATTSRRYYWAGHPTNLKNAGPFCARTMHVAPPFVFLDSGYHDWNAHRPLLQQVLEIERNVKESPSAVNFSA